MSLFILKRQSPQVGSEGDYLNESNTGYFLCLEISPELYRQEVSNSNFICKNSDHLCLLCFCELGCTVVGRTS